MSTCNICHSPYFVCTDNDRNRSADHAGALGQYVQSARKGHEARISGPAYSTRARASLQAPSSRSAGNARSGFPQVENSGLRPRMLLASPRELPESQRTENQSSLLAGEIRQKRRARQDGRGCTASSWLERRHNMGMRHPRSRKAAGRASQNFQFVGPGCRKRQLAIERNKNKWPGPVPCAEHQV